jgi:CRISPR-associated endonuclease/helicase Cas3
VAADNSGFGDIANVYQDPTSQQWSSWPDIVASLRQRYGPYSLALLETILRLADWECSAENAEGDGDA